MKTLFATITVATTILFGNNAYCQSINAVSMEGENTTSKNFSISSLSIKPGANGFTVTWEASNQFSVASYELQLSEDNTNFSTVKRRTSGPETNAKFKVQLTNTLILANPVYYRIKVITLDGKVSYTESKRVRTEEI